ncbi:MAG: ABC-type transport auxiliary lipoprotein family protein [Pseudomonadota bacterium]
MTQEQARMAVAATPLRRAVLLLAAGVALAGCSALPDKPARPLLYDFGPGTVAALPQDRRAPLPPLALGEVETAGVADTAAVLFRLQYADAQQLRPYALARWSLPPAQLVRQRLRERLGERRAVMDIDDALAQRRIDGRLPLMLRLQLEEFSQVFPAPATSFGVVRLRATLLDKAADGERLLGQRLFVVQRPALTADAAGGVGALAAATDAAADEIAGWLELVPPGP